MNRKLRFRTWDEADKEMIYMNFEMLATGAYYIDESNPIMQFTGLVDREGVEIFEGDIVRCNVEGSLSPITPYGETVIGNVYFKAGCWCIEHNTEYLMPLYNYDVEIIGNIYESKNLLEDAKC